MIFRIVNSKILQNFVILSCSQGINLLFPLLITPYLIQIVGFEKLGLLSILQTISTYFFILIDYGFNINAVRSISKNKDNKSIVSKIVFDTILTKFILTVIAFPFFYIVSFFFLNTDKSFSLILSSYTIVIAQGFLPIWFFQGLNKTYYLFVLNLISRLVIMVLVFTFIKKSDDYIWINLILGSIPIFFNTVLLIYGINNYCSFINLTFSFHNFVNILKEGWYTFKSNISINLYTNSGVLILATIGVSKIEIGYFSAIEKVIQILRIPIGMYLQSTYPLFFPLSENTSPLLFFRKYMLKPYLLFFIFTVILTLVLYGFVHQITYFIARNEESHIIQSIYVISILPLSILIFNVPYYQIFLVYGNDKKVSKILQRCSVIGLIILFIFSTIWQVIGLSVGIVLTEIMVGITLAISFHTTHKSITYVKLQNMWSKSFFYKTSRRVQKRHEL